MFLSPEAGIFQSPPSVRESLSSSVLLLSLTSQRSGSICMPNQGTRPWVSAPIRPDVGEYNTTTRAGTCHNKHTDGARRQTDNHNREHILRG